MVIKIIGMTLACCLAVGVTTFAMTKLITAIENLFKEGDDDEG
jgi:hypothetical protein